MKISYLKKFILVLSFLIIVLVAIQNKFSAFNTDESVKKIIFVSEKETIEKAYRSIIDIHEEGSSKEQVVSGGRLDLYSLPQKVRRTHIAIGGGITSKGIKSLNRKNFNVKFSFFVDFLPSFCKTASLGFHYNFYFAFDKNDRALMKLLKPFHNAFNRKSHSSLCRHLSLSLHLIKCSHNKRPAWAQNDAMIEAYLDGNEYFYRINDDSKLYSYNWTHIYLQHLSSFTPANIGVVGPNHIGGNTDILTYDFVHRNHIDIFGFYYPRLFTDWWADDWITNVYRPHHMKKIQNVYLKHTQTLGRRYNPDYKVSHHVANQIRMDQLLLHRYIKAVSEAPIPPKFTKVISMSLYGNDPDLHFGVIRCAQLRLVYFPDWKLRVYTVKRGHDTTDDIKDNKGNNNNNGNNNKNDDDDNNNNNNIDVNNSNNNDDNKTTNNVNSINLKTSHLIHSSPENVIIKDDDDEKLDDKSLFKAFNKSTIATTTTNVNNNNTKSSSDYITNINSVNGSSNGTLYQISTDATIDDDDYDDDDENMLLKENSTILNNHTTINNINNNENNDINGENNDNNDENINNNEANDNKENDNQNKVNLSVPKRILQTLEMLGAEIVYINDSQSELLPPDTWSYLVADDETVDYFEIRDGRFRLNKRDAVISEDFIEKSLRLNALCDGVSKCGVGALNGDGTNNNNNNNEYNKKNNNHKNGNNKKNNHTNNNNNTYSSTRTYQRVAFHCIRDKHNDKNKAVVAGLWGGVAKEVRTLLRGNTLEHHLALYFSQNVNKNTLNNSNGDVIKSSDVIKLSEANTTNDDVNEHKKIINSETFLREFLWNNFRQNFMCHDSVSCDKWSPVSTSDFKMASFSSRSITDILGLAFNRFQIPSDPKWTQEVKLKFTKNTKCSYNLP